MKIGEGPKHSGEVEKTEAEAAGMPDKVEGGSGKESGQAEKTGPRLRQATGRLTSRKTRKRKKKIRSAKRQSLRRAAKLKMQMLRPRQCLIK